MHVPTFYTVYRSQFESSLLHPLFFLRMCCNLSLAPCLNAPYFPVMTHADGYDRSIIFRGGSRIFFMVWLYAGACKVVN